MKVSGNIRKMVVEHVAPVAYSLPVGEQTVEMTPLLGRKLSLVFDGEINCIACGRKTRKSYNQGYCFPCTQKLAECDICIVRPEKCHFHEGTCREPEWGEAHCMQPHVLYLANSSGLKVGITRRSQVPTRWIDQGAGEALPILTTQSRYQVGLLEHGMKAFIADRTDWRRMLKGPAEPRDLFQAREDILTQGAQVIAEVRERFGADCVQIIESPQVHHFDYPVEHYPDKVKALNFDKTPTIEGVLQGIKGQYLIFDTGVLNVRKFSGYRLEISAEE